jgi:hypothetical protein
MTKVVVNLNCRSAADEEQLKLAIIPRSGLDTVAGRIDHCTAELRYGTISHLVLNERRHLGQELNEHMHC